MTSLQLQRACLILLACLLPLVVNNVPRTGTAQGEDLRPTVEAMQTEISGLRTQVAATKGAPSSVYLDPTYFGLPWTKVVVGLEQDGLVVAGTVYAARSLIEEFGIDLEAAGIVDGDVVGLQDHGATFGAWVPAGTSVTLVIYDDELARVSQTPTRTPIPARTPIPPSPTTSTSHREDSGTGTFRSPREYGEPLGVGEWTIRVSGAEVGAEVTVATIAGSMSTVAAGMTFVLVYVEIGYHGDGYGDIRSLEMAIVTRDGLVYRDFSGCGDVPDQPADAPGLMAGAILTVNICVVIPGSKTDDLVLSVMESIETEFTYFALFAPSGTPTPTTVTSAGGDARATADAAIRTSEALSTRQAVLYATVTVLAAQAQGNAIEQDAAEIQIRVDAEGLIDGDPSAERSARRLMDEALDGLDGCRAGVVLTYGTHDSIGGGQQLARAANALLREYYPGIFGDAAFTDLADLTEVSGTVTITVYFFTGCVPSSE